MSLEKMVRQLGVHFGNGVHLRDNHRLQRPTCTHEKKHASTPRPPPDQHRFDAADRRALATSRPLERIAVEASLLPARSVRRHHAKAARHASTLAQIVQLPADCIALWLLGSRRTLLCSSPLLAWSRGFCFSFPRCHVVHFYCTTLFGRHLSTEFLFNCRLHRVLREKAGCAGGWNSVALIIYYCSNGDLG